MDSEMTQIISGRLALAQRKIGLVLVLVVPGHERHDGHVGEHESGEEEEAVVLKSVK
jgi:hypothetical protein